MPVPAQDGITRDNVTVRVDAVVYFRVIDPMRAVVEVQDYEFAISQVAQTSLRSIIGKSELDDLLSNRERLNQGLEVMLDSPAASWGIEIDRVEIKDVALPESMKRSMSRQAEAERERRSRIITADGEFQASKKLSRGSGRDGRDTRPRCSCGCCRRWSRWRPRRTRPWCCRSRSRCCATSRRPPTPPTRPFRGPASRIANPLRRCPSRTRRPPRTEPSWTRAPTGARPTGLTVLSISSERTPEASTRAAARFAGAKHRWTRTRECCAIGRAIRINAQQVVDGLI